MAAKKTSQSILTVGSTVLIRTVTMIQVGRVVSMDERFVELADASWVADTGRFSAALTTGSLSEVEPFPAGCLVGVGAIVDVAPWPHPLPRTVK